MTQRWALATAAGIVAAALCPLAVRAQVPEALAALEAGDAAAARAALAREIARLSWYQALAESGAARAEALARALALAEEGSWVRDAATALQAADAGEVERAAAAAGRAAAAAPGEALLWKELGDLLVRQDDGAGARSAYERAIAIRPGYGTALLALGGLQLDEAEFTLAFNTFNHAVLDAGAPAVALVGRANARLYLGDAEGALADLERAAALAPAGDDRHRALLASVNLHAYRRELPLGLERAEEAMRMWAGLGRVDRIAETLNAVARVLLETGDPGSAAAWYERSWQTIEASNLPAEERTIWRVRSLHGRSRCAAAGRDLDAAESLAAEARALMAADPANRAHYAWIEPYLDGYLALARRRYDDAVAVLRRSDLERAHLRLLLAQAYERTRDRANARLWYERALAAATGLDTESVIVRPVASAWLAKNR